jgi:hypothetical protein
MNNIIEPLRTPPPLASHACWPNEGEPTFPCHLLKGESNTEIESTPLEEVALDLIGTWKVAIGPGIV